MPGVCDQPDGDSSEHWFDSVAVSPVTHTRRIQQVRRAVAKARQDIVEEHSRDLSRVTRELQSER